MGEIKSTLDLVMERTRHLTQSEAEKEASMAQQQRQLIRGLVQQFLDQALTQKELVRKLAGDNSAELCAKGGPLHRELLQRLAPDPDPKPDSESNSQALLELLKTLCGVDPAPLDGILREFRDALDTARKERTAERLADLAATRGIGGTALIPNLARDPQWPSTRDGLVNTYTQRLEQTSQPAGV
jgi:hypothetical protein